jgi:hypothetical protein
MQLRGAHRGNCNSFFYFRSCLFIPYFFSFHFLLLIAISVSVGPIWDSIKAKVNRV